MVQASWQIFDPDWPHTLIVVDVVNPNVVWAAGGGFPPPPSPEAPDVPGTVVRTIDGGQTWQHRRPAGTAQVYRDVEAFSPNHAVVLAPKTSAGHSQIFHTGDGGTVWTTSFNADPNEFWESMAFFDDQRGLAVSDPPAGGKFRILATDDGGATWELVDTKAMSNSASGEAALATGTSMFAVGPRDAWFGTDFDSNVAPNSNARVFHTPNGGKTWIDAETPLHRIPSLSFRDRRHGLVVGGDLNADVGTVVRTNNGGNTWSPVETQPLGFRHSVAWIPDLEDTAVIVGPKGSDISDDGGATWTSIDFDAPFPPI
jgi:photosystem II stability/assembly factor-like uncharacterized protein